jgi:hypothetical protein
MISAWVGRHRRILLLAGVVVAAVLAYVGWAAALLVVLIPLAVLDQRRRRPVGFVVEPRRRVFAAPAPAAVVYGAVAALAPAAAGVAWLLRHDRLAERWWLPVAAAVGLWLLVCSGLVVSAWRGGDVELGVDGVRAVGALGSLTVPWGAFVASRPVRRATRESLVLVAEPGMLRRRGLVSGRPLVRVDEVDGRFVAHAIRFYVARPAERAGIGTPAGYAELRVALRVAARPGPVG